MKQRTVVGFNASSKRFNQLGRGTNLPGPGSYLDQRSLSSFKTTHTPPIPSEETELLKSQSPAKKTDGPGPGQYPLPDPWKIENDRSYLLKTARAQIQPLRK